MLGRNRRAVYIVESCSKSILVIGHGVRYNVFWYFSDLPSWYFLLISLCPFFLPDEKGCSPFFCVFDKMTFFVRACSREVVWLRRPSGVHSMARIRLCFNIIWIFVFIQISLTYYNLSITLIKVCTLKSATCRQVRLRFVEDMFFLTSSFMPFGKCTYTFHKWKNGTSNSMSC